MRANLVLVGVALFTIPISASYAQFTNIFRADNLGIHPSAEPPRNRDGLPFRVSHRYCRHMGAAQRGCIRSERPCLRLVLYTSRVR